MTHVKHFFLVFSVTSGASAFFQSVREGERRGEGKVQINTIFMVVYE